MRERLQKWICLLCYMDVDGTESLLDEVTNIVARSWGEAQGKGWRATVHPDISPNGKPVFLCPNHAREAFH